MEPKISVIMVGRNDSYGGDFITRMQVCLDSLFKGCKNESLPIEIVVTEWDYESEASLKDVLLFNRINEFCRVRFFRVSKTLCDKLYPQDRPFLDHIARNVAIRRASAPFILSTNPDIVFSRELLKFLSEVNLSYDCYYRAVRCDINDIADISKGKFTAIHQYYGKMTKCISKVGDLFTNACGDFFLMAKKHWFTIKGHPEFSTRGHFDSYVCCMAASLGLEQIILPHPELVIYHLNHSRSLRNTSLESFWRNCDRMLKNGKLTVYNDENWGLNNYSLEETVVEIN